MPGKKADLALGALSGFCTGIICHRIGKVVAISFTGGIFIIRIMEQTGYLKVNWDKLTKDYDQCKRKLNDSKPIISGCKECVVTYKYFSAAFVGGFLLGVSCSNSDTLRLFLQVLL